MLLRFCILFWLLHAPASVLWADISLPKIFSDHMVVQQNAKMRIWGNASPKEKLTVTFDKKEYPVVANPSGNWSTLVPTGSARGPIEIMIASDDSGGAKVIIKDVLIGEVWLCCGQENMQLPVSEMQAAEEQISDAKNFPKIRLFDVKPHQANQPLDDFANVKPWLCCSNDSIENFSALGFLFGKKLCKELDTPIGLIDIARAGTTLEAWTPYAAMQDSKKFDELIGHWKDKNEPNNPNSPGNCFNGMVSPLTSFPLAGVIWSQGEANVGRGAQYAELFPVTIRSWRDCFSSSNLPFYFVQPAPLRYENFSREALPEIWEAQSRTFDALAGVAMVVTSDLADRKSIQIAKKQELATRLANWALSKYDKPKMQTASTSGTESTNVANKTDPLSGPIFASSKISGNGVLIEFKYAKNGLKLTRVNETGFLICGPDKKFLPASVEIDGSKLRVSHPDIASPLAVRYGWSDTAEAILTNSSGLPAASFRTDNFPLISAGIHF